MLVLIALITDTLDDTFPESFKFFDGRIHRLAVLMT